VLAALDPKTRKRLRSVVAQLQQTLDGREPDVNATMTTAGPAVEALGELLRGVGQDGPAIRQLVTKLRRVVTTLSDRDADLGGTVRNLGRFVGSTARQQEQLKAALDELPSTVRAGSKLFGKVPGAVDATVPLLRELRPATRELPEVARNLGPVLRELRPTVDALRPTLGAARSLLAYTPELLDTAHETLPGMREAVDQVQPAARFLRPYTPEVIGYLSNWTSLFSGKNPSGHFGRALITNSASAATDNPGIVPPGMKQDPAPAPGSLVGQPWTDANGDGIR
jgi:phospholipid/cholesterol/gamma-HCH transport system substrate-binding protein